MSRKKINAIYGDRFGRLVIINEIEKKITKKGNKERRVLCECDCGKETTVYFKNLRSGLTKSCGCLRKDLKTTHNSTNIKEYNVWKGIKRRCLNKKTKDYKNYGGRGITVCDRWLGENGFYNFFEDMGVRKTGLTIDRINNNGNYCKENCKWATKTEQDNNRRSNVFLELNGVSMSMKQWSKKLSISYEAIKYRYGKGLDINKILK